MSTKGKDPHALVAAAAHEISDLGKSGYLLRGQMSGGVQQAIFDVAASLRGTLLDAGMCTECGEAFCIDDSGLCGDCIDANPARHAAWARGFT